MTHNKGAKLIQCKECKRRRYCRSVRIPDYNFRWTCSKGHIWIEQGVTLNRINLIAQDTLLPNLIKAFERDDVFYRNLKK